MAGCASSDDDAAIDGALPVVIDAAAVDAPAVDAAAVDAPAVDAPTDPIDAATFDADVVTIDAASFDAATVPIDAAPIDAAVVPVDAAVALDAVVTGPTHPTGLPGGFEWNGQPWVSDTSPGNTGYPIVSGSEITLTPNQNDRGAAIFLEKSLLPPFQVEFEYIVDDSDGCATLACQYSSADGFALVFFKDTAKYLSEAPPTGGGRGIIEDGTGVRLSFEIYAGNKITLKGPTGVLLKTLTTAVFTGPTWRKVRVLVGDSRIAVFLDDATMPQLTYDSPTPFVTTHSWLGFGAGTGGAAAEHKLRNVVVTQ